MRFLRIFFILCFNTCSSCEEQPVSAETQAWKARVSIHAPLARSNEPQLTATPPTVFQYMLLLRGATCNRRAKQSVKQFQYMLLLRGAT